MSYRIYLSPPHLFSDEAERMTRALDSGWDAYLRRRFKRLLLGLVLLGPTP